jgi:hypothetical protein
MKTRSHCCSNFVLFLAALTLTGCGSIHTYGPPPGAINPIDNTRSLIPSDAAILSDQDIARILTARVEVPTSMRIAVLHLAHEGINEWSWRREDVQNDLRAALQPVLKLRDNARVFDVSFLPGFLLPAQPSIPLIREAAARYQADWVLVVRTASRGHRRDRLFAKDQARAYCEAECVVLDVRTGTIPYTSVAQGEATVTKTDDEYSLAETAFRAEKEAIAKAMAENVAGLLAFLERVQGS